jgi:hypothetical protein
MPLNREGKLTEILGEEKVRVGSRISVKSVSVVPAGYRKGVGGAIVVINVIK